MLETMYSVAVALAYAVLVVNIFLAYLTHKNYLRTVRQLRVLKAYIDFYKAQAKKDGVVVPLPAPVEYKRKRGCSHARNNHDHDK